jgi:prophage tail gpP-like protein
VAARNDYVSLEAGGERFDTWTEYTVESDLLTAADAFSLTVEIGGVRRDMRGLVSNMRELLTPGVPMRLFVGRDVTGAQPERALQMNGIVDTRDIQANKANGTVIAVRGRDLAAHLTDSSIALGVLGSGEMTLLQVVRAAVAPWGLEVITDGSAGRDILTGRAAAQTPDALQAAEARAFGISPAAYSRILRRRAERERRAADGGAPSARSRTASSNGLAPGDVDRLKVKDAKPKPGETVWAFLQRHVARFGLLLWLDPRGKLVISAPRYNTPPIARLVRRYVNKSDDPNTIVGGGGSNNIADRVSSVTVYGRTHGDDATRSAISHTETDADWPATYTRPLILHDNSVRTAEEAQRRARRELRMRAVNARVLDYEVVDHGQGAYLYAVDSMVTVDDEVEGATGAWYVTSRTFTASRDRGTTTRLRLVPPGSLVL